MAIKYWIFNLCLAKEILAPPLSSLKVTVSISWSFFLEAWITCINFTWSEILEKHRKDKTFLILSSVLLKFKLSYNILPFHVKSNSVICKPSVLDHSHKKRKDSLAGISLIPELFAVDFEFLSQATSEYIKCKHRKYREIKITVLLIWPTSWTPDISSFYLPDINLFLIDYVWCKLCNKCLFLFQNNSRSLRLEENIVAVITQGQVVGDNWKRKIKSRTFYTCRLLLLNWIFQYISNWKRYFSFSHPRWAPFSWTLHLYFS